MSAEIIPLGVAFRPHVIDGDAPVEFGKRKRSIPDLSKLAGGFMEVLDAFDEARERPEDRAEVERVKHERRAEKIAQAGENAARAARGHICPSLLHAKAGHAEGIAQGLRALASECKALGAFKQAATFDSVAGFVETAAAELEAL